MMFRKNIIFFAVLSLLLLVISGCGDRKGDLYPNEPPVIYITSYGGVDSLEAVEDSTIFQQKIYWEAHDSDGIVKAYAFRITDEDGNPISTPGNEFFNEDGWVLHYEDGADESIPLNESEQTTIWSNQVYAVINFPANGPQIFDEFGDPVINPETGNFVYEPVVSKFEIKCIDDRGDESIIREKFFRASSLTPSVLVNSTQGSIDKKTIGTGVVLDFLISDKDPLIGDEPNYFLFKLEKRDLSGNTIPLEEGGYSDTWYDTRDATNEYDDVTKYLLTPNTIPALKVNTDNDSTVVTAIAYDLAGIESQPKEITFKVKEGFHPGTIFYDGYNPNGDGNPDKFYNDIFVIGDNHYSTIKSKVDDTIPISRLPEIIKPEAVHYGLPFWLDTEDRFTALYSDNIKVYLHWGYLGEYGKPAVQSGGDPTVTNSVHGETKLGIVQDEDLQAPYFTELIAFDLQFDGEPYVYPPLVGKVETIADSNGVPKWTRIPVGEEIDQTTILYGLTPGEHTFKVRAVDLSGVGDPTPAEFTFYLEEVIPAEEKSGILIIDEDTNSPFSPDEDIDSVYVQALSDYSGAIHQIDLEEISVGAGFLTKNRLLHFRNDYISPTDMQHYELIIFHSEQSSTLSNFGKNNNSLNLYFAAGGNMIAVLAHSLYDVYDYCNDNSIFLLNDYFGIPFLPYGEEGETVELISATISNMPYLIGAAPTSTPDVSLDLELNPEFAFVPALHMVYKGIGMTCEILSDVMAEPIYSYVCKDTLAAAYPPSQVEYESLNGVNIAAKYTSMNNNQTYTFAFPVSFMEVQDLREMFNQILSELGM